MRQAASGTILAFLLLPLLCSGCSGDSREQQLRRDIAQLREELAELEHSGTRHSERMEQMQRRVRLLEYQIEQEVSRAAQAGRDPEPEEVKVIRLGPTEAPADRLGGQAPVIRSGGDAPGPRPGTQWLTTPAGPLLKIGPLSGPPPAVEALRRLVSPAGDRPLRVVQYGDSHTAAAGLADELRRRLSRGAPSSPGYVQVGLPTSWDARVAQAGGWKAQNWLHSKAQGPFGPLGVAYVAQRPGAELTLELRGGGVPESGVEVTALYSRSPDQLPFQLRAGSRVLATVTPPNRLDAARALGLTSVNLPAGSTNLRLTLSGSGQRSDQELRVFGFLVRYPGAQVQWDTLGVGGTTVMQPLLRSDETLTQYLRQQDPGLLVVWFGTNTVPEPRLDVNQYGRNYAALLQKLRQAAPGAQCLALGPPDLLVRQAGCFAPPKGEPPRPAGKGQAAGRERSPRVCQPDGLLVQQGSRTHYPVAGVHDAAGWEAYKAECAFRTPTALEPLNAIQQRAAHERGCVYFDILEYMGGPRSILRWACEGEVQLAMYDLVHLTQSGYRQVARGILDSL